MAKLYQYGSLKVHEDNLPSCYGEYLNPQNGNSEFHCLKLCPHGRFCKIETDQRFEKIC